MRFCLFAVVLLVLPSFWTVSAGAQDWEVEGELSIEDLGDPGFPENSNESFNNQPKIQIYSPLLEITEGNSNIGFGTVDYSKDSDPFGDFVLTITATSQALLEVVFTLGHEMIDVSVGSFEMRSTLSVELIDLGGGGVSLTAAGALLAPGVREVGGLGTVDILLPTVALAIDEILIGEGTTTYDSGIVNYTRNTTTVAMLIGGSFQLTAGDRAILRGRFEIDRELPVVSRTWSEIKELYID